MYIKNIFKYQMASKEETTVPEVVKVLKEYVEMKKYNNPSVFLHNINKSVENAEWTSLLLDKLRISLVKIMHLQAGKGVL